MKSVNKKANRQQRFVWKNIVCIMVAFMLLCLTRSMVFGAAISGTITGLRQTDATDNSVSIQYFASFDTTVKYSIQVSSSKTGVFSEMAVTEGSSASILGLAAGTSYYVRVVPFFEKEGSKEYGQSSDVLSVSTAPGQAPNTIIQTGSTDNSITVLWDAVFGANGYEVSYCLTDSVTSERVRFFANTNTATLTGLSKTKSYSVYITPYRMSEAGFIASNKEKTASKSNLAVGLADTSVPTEVVAGIVQTKATANSVELTFPTLNNISTQYAVFYSKGNSQIYTEAGVTKQGTYTLTDLEAGSHYAVYVVPFHQVWNSLNEEYDRIYGTASPVADVVTMVTERPKEILQTNATGASISLEWDAVKGADGYLVEYYLSGTKTAKSCTVNQNSAKLTGLSQNKEYNIFVTPLCMSSSGYVAYDRENYTCLYNVPVKPQKANKVSVNAYWRSIGKLNVSTKKMTGADGYQYQLYTAHLEKNKKLATVNSSSYSSAEIKGTFLKSDAAFKVRVRAYIWISGKKVYGAWSDWTYLATPQQTKLVLSEQQIAASWNTIKGADRYVVYVSTQKDYGYKKSAITKNTSCEITKYGSSKLKKGERYFVYVVAQKKIGKTYVTLKPNGVISNVKFY